MLTKNSLQQELGRICPNTLYHDLHVAFNHKAGAWCVDFTCHNHHLYTFLDEGDARTCTDKHNCLSAGLQLGEVASNDLALH